MFTISNALQLDAVRRCPDHNLFDALMSLFKRSVNVDQDGIGWIPVLLRPGRAAPGLKGRIFSSGIGRVPAQEAPAKKRKGNEGAVDSAQAEFMKQLPPEIRKKIEMGVPDTLVGRSAFAFKKLVRYITRHRLGSVELDIKNSFFQLLNRQKPLPPIMAEYLDHREEKLAQIARVLFHKLPEARRRSVASEASRGCRGGRARAGGPVGIRGGEVPQLGLETQVEDGVLRAPPTAPALQAARHTWTGEGKHHGLCEAGGGAAGPGRTRSSEGGEKRTTYESFEKGGFWLVRNRDDLGQTVEDLMCKMCCPVFETVDENYVPPPPLNDNAFFTGLPLSVLGRLAGRRWRTSTATRHGTKSSFATACSTISRSVSSDHRSPPTAWASTQRRPQRCGSRARRPSSSSTSWLS